MAICAFGCLFFVILSHCVTSNEVCGQTESGCVNISMLYMGRHQELTSSAFNDHFVA